MPVESASTTLKSVTCPLLGSVADRDLFSWIQTRYFSNGSVSSRPSTGFHCWIRILAMKCCKIKSKWWKNWPFLQSCGKKLKFILLTWVLENSFFQNFLVLTNFWSQRRIWIQILNRIQNIKFWFAGFWYGSCQNWTRSATLLFNSYGNGTYRI